MDLGRFVSHLFNISLINRVNTKNKTIFSKQFRDFENLQGLKDSNRAIKWIILGTKVGREDGNKVAQTFGLRNPHFIDNEGESTVLMEKPLPFYYQLKKTYYLDKATYLD